ncbi:MAG: hypothetical protein LBJ13_00400 [Puniceicoccales bacterium]|jgi:hypothetical protein|nr:hypothetical protein [Puniceicoccales bacterium]
MMNILLKMKKIVNPLRNYFLISSVGMAASFADSSPYETTKRPSLPSYKKVSPTNEKASPTTNRNKPPMDENQSTNGKPSSLIPRNQLPTGGQTSKTPTTTSRNQLPTGGSLSGTSTKDRIYVTTLLKFGDGSVKGSYSDGKKFAQPGKKPSHATSCPNR